MIKKISTFLSLFTSSATLFCCAIPALLSVIAGGIAVSGFLSAFPWLVTLSMYKKWLFIVAGILILLNGFLIYRPIKKKKVCPIDEGKGCEVAGGFTKTVFWIAVIIYSIGFFVAYPLVPILRFLEN